MAKRTSALFEALGAQARGGSRPEPRRRRPEPESSGRGAFEWLRGRFAPRREAAPAPAALPGVLLAALALGALALGFVLGRATAGGAAPADGHLRRVAGLPEGRAPMWLGSRELEEEELSNFGFPLLYFPAPERARAVRVLAWLRGQGLESTRLRNVTQKVTGEPYVGVVVYTQDAEGRLERAMLELLARAGWPALESELAAALDLKVPELPERPKRFP